MDERFSRRRDGAEEEDAPEDEARRIDGAQIDLTDCARELLVLELPMRFECREGCPGSEELKAWNENNPVSSNDAGASTQHPFEALRSLLEPRE